MIFGKIIDLILIINRITNHKKHEIMKLEFSTKSISEILAEFEDKKTFDWQNDIFNFLRKHDESSSAVKFHYALEDNVYTSVFNREFVSNTFKSLNDYLGLKKGDTALLSSSVLENEGEIVILQAIEGGLDLYCNEDSDEIKIPYTGEHQDEIGFAIDYAYVTKVQAENSMSNLVRINKVAIEVDSLNNDLSKQLNKIDKTSFYKVYTANGYPVAIKKNNDVEFSVLDKIEISEDEKGSLILNSPYEEESLNTHRQVVIIDDKKFRFLSNNECRLGNNGEIINLEQIEEKLKPYIDLNYVVIDFPQKETGKEVITLVIESRFSTEINIPNNELEEREVPQQTFFIGEFPKSQDKSAIRADLKRLLKESNKKD